MIHASQLPRPAATLILARDTCQGMQVLMLKRSAQADHIAGAYVFPGGTVEASDRAEVLLQRCDGRALESEQMALKFCAIRECFEEAGLLLATDAVGRLVEIETEQVLQCYAEARRDMIAGSMNLAELCNRQDIKPATQELMPFGHWITPRGAVRRFDTHFFVGAAPARQTPSNDEVETVAHVWIRPQDALERQRSGDMRMVLPTVKMLEALACFDTCKEMMDHARIPRVIHPIQTRLANGRAGVRPVGPWEAAYAEIGKIDPDGKASASYEILPGVPVRLSQRIVRITAPNGGFMTGPGTNTYLLGTGNNIAVIDPGPENEIHLQALLEETRGCLRWILVTHTHQDHSPAAARLRERTGAEVWGPYPVLDQDQDASFHPDRLLKHGERLEIAGCTLRVLHTPGHAANHLCYLLEDERVLFAGDHVMQGASVIIDPPDGDMSAYLESLKATLEEDISFIAPGHGFLIDHPHQEVERILLHRLMRENKIYNALCMAGEAHLDILLELAYDDVHPRLRRAAARSLLAHLIKLEREGRAAFTEQGWRATTVMSDGED